MGRAGNGNGVGDAIGNGVAVAIGNGVAVAFGVPPSATRSTVSCNASNTASSLYGSGTVPEPFQTVALGKISGGRGG